MLKEDESGSLKASVEEILFQSKKRRCVRSTLSPPAGHHVPGAPAALSPACVLVFQAGPGPRASQAGDGELLLWSSWDSTRDPGSLLH